MSNLELARRTKILGTKEINDKYDILVWMDAAVTFKKSIKDFIKTYFDKDDNFIWKDVLKLSGNCDRINSTELDDEPDIYDIQRLIEYHFDDVKW